MHIALISVRVLFSLKEIFGYKLYLILLHIPLLQVMYGGRAIDDFDRRVLNTYMNEYMGDFIFDTFQPFHFHCSNDVDYLIPSPSEDVAMNKYAWNNIVLCVHSYRLIRSYCFSAVTLANQHHNSKFDQNLHVA